MIPHDIRQLLEVIYTRVVSNYFRLLAGFIIIINLYVSSIFKIKMCTLCTCFKFVFILSLLELRLNSIGLNSFKRLGPSPYFVFALFKMKMAEKGTAQKQYERLAASFTKYHMELFREDNNNNNNNNNDGLFCMQNGTIS